MKKPWLDHNDPWVKPHLEYPDLTMYEAVVRSARNYPDYTALTFMGLDLTYSQLVGQIDLAAASLQNVGFKSGDIATICLPNTPHAVIFFYAVNRLGGICNMVHPLTPAEEMAHYIRTTKSDYLIILDAFLKNHTVQIARSRIHKTIVCSLMDYLKPLLKAGFYLTKGRKIKRTPRDSAYIRWKAFMQLATPAAYTAAIDAHDCAVYLHSGGTTGKPKTIRLSSYNFNALAVQGPQIIGLDMDKPFDPAGLSMVSILPLFHGFGLCMGLHAMLANGMRAILVPQFTPDFLADVMIKEKPSFIAAVPTLFEGILANPKLQSADLSCLKAVFCGGDTLPADLKNRFDSFLKDHQAECTLREGYGLTETVTVCAVNPMLDARDSTVGVPLADVLMKVIDPKTLEELEPGQDGEFCVHAPTIMMGYLDDPEATAQVIRRHEDGLDWVHTGDFGNMDGDGYFHFKQRIKRILKVSGVPVFPSQIEDLAASVEGVSLACAIGIPHPYKMQVVKLFVVPEDPDADQSVLEKKILQVSERNLIPYAVPKEIEFRKDLPKTKVGKIDFISLERSELEQQTRKGDN